jgi:phage tail sheath gpL-like
VTVSGRNVRRVAFFVGGRQVRTVTMRAGQRSLTVSLPVRRVGARRQSVRARVSFRNGAAPRNLTTTATRCAQGAVSPQFTG